MSSYLKMFFILFNLLVGATAVNLIDFENFQIEFVPTCQEFFLFNGSSDYAYFYQRNGKFELWLTQNSSSYAVYIMKNSSILLFGWTGIYAEINGQIMEPVIQEGIITYPLEFDSEQYLCDIISLTAGSIKNQHIECEPLTYKCKNKSNWLLICSSTLTISIVACLLLYVKNESIKAVLRSTISWLLQWRRQVLFGGEEVVSQSDEEESFTDSTEIGRLHFTQKIHSTQEISENLDSCTEGSLANRFIGPSKV